MRSMLKLLFVLALALGISGVYAPVVLAAPPANDLFSGATLVTLGFSEVLDTTEATTDANDAQANQFCGAPATDASVWYALEGTGQTVVVDVSQSDYLAGVIVGVGSEGNLELVTCGPDAVAFTAESGITYYILAFDDQGDGGGNGGMLNISFIEAPPAPTVEITVDPYGTFNSKTGEATISGTYTCSNGSFLEIYIDARQEAGRFTVWGFGEVYEYDTCDGLSHNWSAQIYPLAGKFAGGKALMVSTAFACGPLQCSTGYAEQKVLLRGKK